VAAPQVFRDLSAPKFEWDRPWGWNKSESHILESVQVGCGAPAMACRGGGGWAGLGWAGRQEGSPDGVGGGSPAGPCPDLPG
jgi:hypothetical protein